MNQTATQVSAAIMIANQVAETTAVKILEAMVDPHQLQPFTFKRGIKGKVVMVKCVPDSPTKSKFFICRYDQDGRIDTEVTFETARKVIECAVFDKYNNPKDIDFAVVP